MKKKILWIGILFLIALGAALQFTPPEFIYKHFVAPRAQAADITDLTATTGLIGKEDISWGATGAETFTVSTYSGGTVTLTKLPNLLANAYSMIKGQWYVAVSDTITDHGAGSGADYTAGNLKKIIDTIGATDVRAIEMPPGTYTIGTDLTPGTNIYFKQNPGAIFSVSTGKTLTILPSNLLAAAGQQIKTGAGTLAFGAAGEIGYGWTGLSTSATAANNTIYLNALYTAMATYGGTIRIPAGTYNVDGAATATVPSNTTVEMAEGCVIQLQTTVSNTEYAFLIDGQDHVTIRGGELIGDAAAPGVATDGSSGIRIIDGSTDVLVDQVEASYFAGDGIYLRGDTGGAGATQLYRITLRDCYVHHNARLGIAITGGEGITVDNCVMSTNGTGATGQLPKGGLDIEPSAGETITDVKVIDCTADNNERNGFQISAATGEVVSDIKFIGCRSDSNGRYGYELSNVAGPLLVEGCTSVSSGSVYGYRSTFGVVTPDDITIIGCSFDKPLFVDATLNTSSENIKILNNRAPMIMVYDALRVTVSGNQTGEIETVYAAQTDSYSMIDGNLVSTDISSGKDGIEITNGNKISVLNNTIKGTTYGIRQITAGDLCNFTGNSIYDASSPGITISGVTNVISGNHIYSTGTAGVQLLDGASHNLVSGNYLYDCNAADTTASIYVASSGVTVPVSHNVIQMNKIFSASGQAKGIWIRETGTGVCESNDVVYNVIEGSGVTIEDSGTSTYETGNR